MDEESNQSQQQQLLESSNSKFTSSSFLYKQIKHSFWVFWTVVGAFLITSIFLSINTITHVDYVKDEEPELTPVVSTHPTASPNSPLWLIVAALGCTVGAIAIAKRRKNLSVLPSPQNQPPEPQVQLSPQAQISSPEENQQIDLIEESEDLLAEEKTLSILEDQLLILEQELEVEDSNAETPSLADMLDIRKKLPLSAILGESYQQLEAENE